MKYIRCLSIFPSLYCPLRCFFDCVYLIRKAEGFLAAAWWNLVLGMVSVITAVITGFLADAMVGHFVWPFVIWKTHAAVQIIAILIFIGLLIWRWRLGGRLPDEPRPRMSFIALEVIAVGILFYGSHLGAILADRI